MRLPQVEVASRRARLLTRRGKLMVLGAIIVVALGGVAAWQVASRPRGDSPAVLVGRTGASTPAFSLPNLVNPVTEISPSELRGKPLVINFWASWCVPCRTEMPLLENAYRGEEGKVVFLGIDTNDTSTAARTFLARLHVTYPVVSDVGGAVAIQYGLYGLPTTVFVSPTGKIVGRHIGQLNQATLRTALNEAFGI
ncbi:MAG TPA: TlpA disulfide reductase family protein [Acidimicrobiales bacterium]|nr:TlpA disulfide reductase family protein [Acidimicrobiales bacterium]